MNTQLTRRMWNFPEGKPPDKLILRVEAKPSEVNEEGYPPTLKAVLDLPARGKLPPV